MSEFSEISRRRFMELAAVVSAKLPQTTFTAPGLAWSAPTIPSQEDLAHRYSAVSGHPLAHWEFQMGLGYFKLGIIVAGIEFRARMATQEGTEPGAVEQPLGDAVAVLVSGGLPALG